MVLIQFLRAHIDSNKMEAPFSILDIVHKLVMGKKIKWHTTCKLFYTHSCLQVLLFSAQLLYSTCCLVDSVADQVLLLSGLQKPLTSFSIVSIMVEPSCEVSTTSALWVEVPFEMGTKPAAIVCC